MKMRTMLATAALALMAFGGAAAADSHHGHGGTPGAGNPGAGNQDMMQMMMRMHGQMMDGGMGMAQGGGMGPGSDPMNARGQGMMDNN